MHIAGTHIFDTHKVKHRPALPTLKCPGIIGYSHQLPFDVFLTIVFHSFIFICFHPQAMNQLQFFWLGQ